MKFWPYLSGQERLVNHWIDLVEVEDEVKLAHIVKVFVQHFDKIVNRFQVHQIIILNVDTQTEEKTSISSIDNLNFCQLDLNSMNRTWIKISCSFNLPCNCGTRQSLCVSHHEQWSMRGPLQSAFVSQSLHTLNWWGLIVKALSFERSILTVSSLANYQKPSYSGQLLTFTADA